MKPTNEKMNQLAQRQKQLKEEMDECKGRMHDAWQTLFAPPVAETRVQHWVNQAERVVAVYDGVMLGYKLCRRLNLIAGWLKPKNKKRK